MSNNLYSIDFTHSLPPPLRGDPNMFALARVIAEQLQTTAKQIKKNIIYARIDELDEQTVDILAYDLHIDWYDYSYPVEVKRRTLKDSWHVHRLLGTKAAVETAIRAIYPLTTVKEWFEYGGRPFTFKIVSKRITTREEKAQCKALIETVKRLSAHLDGFVALIEHVFHQDNRFCFHALCISAAFYNRGVKPVLFDGAACFDGALLFDQWEDARMHLRKLCLRFLLSNRSVIRALWYWNSRFQQAMHATLPSVQLQARFWNRRQVSYRMAANVAVSQKNTVTSMVSIHRTHDFHGNFLFDGSKAFNAGITEEEF